MSKELPGRVTSVPGARVQVTLDVAEASLPVLLEGIQVTRCWLVDEGDGVYSFHATETLGEMRRQPGKPASDVLRDLLNDFAANLEADDVPEWLGEKWDALVDEYTARTAEEKRPGARP